MANAMNEHDFMANAMNEHDHLLLTRKTASPHTARSGTYLALGLASEAGEVCDLFKKSLNLIKPGDEHKLELELGDVLWYLTRLADTFEIPMEHIRGTNAAKLEQRLAQGTLVSRQGRSPV